MENFAFHIIKTNLIAAVFVMLVLLAAHFLKTKYTALWKYCMWLIITVFLLVPVNPLNSAAPLHLVVPSQDTGISSAAAKGPEPAATAANRTDGADDTAAQITVYSEKVSLYGLLQIFILVWGAGAVLLALFRTIQYQLTLRNLRRWSLPADSAYVQTLYRTACRKEHIARPPQLMIHSGITSPILAGLTRPCLYLPANIYSDQELKLIFCHELSHYRRHDLWYKMLLLCVSTIHWFNPALYLMTKEAEKDIENLCDSRVTEGCTQPERQLYNQLLLKTATGQHALPYLAASLNDSTLVFKERIRYMLRAGSLKRGITPALFLGAVLVFSGMLIGCSAPKQPQQTPDSGESALSTADTAASGKAKAQTEEETPQTVAVTPAVLGSYDLPAAATDAVRQETGIEPDRYPSSSDPDSLSGTSSGSGYESPGETLLENSSGSPSDSNAGKTPSGSTTDSPSDGNTGETPPGNTTDNPSDSNTDGTGTGSSENSDTDSGGTVPQGTPTDMTGTILTVKDTSFEIQNPDGTTEWYWYDPGLVNFQNGNTTLTAGDTINITYFSDTREVQHISGN